MNFIKKFVKNDDQDLEGGYDDIYVMPEDLKIPDEETAAAPSYMDAPIQKEPEIRPASPEKVSLKLLQPKSYSEATAIADRLTEGCIVLLDISNLTKDKALRLVDFLAGAVYVLGGKMIKTNKNTIVVSPAGVDISSFAPDVAEEAPAQTADEASEFEEYQESASQEI